MLKALIRGPRKANPIVPKKESADVWLTVFFSPHHRGLEVERAFPLPPEHENDCRDELGAGPTVYIRAVVIPPALAQRTEIGRMAPRWP